ncbi:MAG: hypothetical protein LBS76_01660 [Mycoplasmataceae bacterium]|nr:hypothetical protein [Mycoplasmataceae bacterium]
MDWYFYIGLIASAAIAVFTVPQLVNIVKTKNTAFINIPMYIIYLIGCLCFLLGGILTATTSLASGLPLIIAQSVCGTISSIIFIWKLKNYFAAKKAKVTELHYCKQLKSLSDEYKRKVYELSNHAEPKVEIVEEK